MVRSSRDSRARGEVQQQQADAQLGAGQRGADGPRDAPGGDGFARGEAGDDVGEDGVRQVGERHGGGGCGGGAAARGRCCC